MAAIDVPTFEQIATILSQLSTNYTNIFADYYNLFYNPTPMDITVQIYDDAGNLNTITIPNRAKDRRYILNGNGDPNNSVSAPKGSVYQDLTNGKAYIKQFANTDNTGWSEFMTLESLEDFIIQGAGNPEGVVTTVKGVLYVDKTNAALYLKSTATGNTGWILISADTANLVNRDLSNLTETGDAHFANPSLSNLNTTGAALINSKENVSNKTNSINSSSTDEQYPTAKAVYDLVGTGTSDLANKSLSNLNATGEDKFVHTMSQVRDCIFKAPNGLLSVSGNVISLPTGTTLLCANGVDSNNAVKNDKITTAGALSVSVSWTGVGNGIVFFDGTSNSLNYKSEGEYFRQTSQPTITTTHGMWYNLNTNEYKVTSNTGSTWATIKAAEIGRFSTDSSGSIDSFYPYHPLATAMEDDIATLKSYTDREKVSKSDLHEVQVVVETYRDGYSWYRVWSDGWCEQGGRTVRSSVGTSWSYTINLVKSYMDTEYNITITPTGKSGDQLGESGENVENVTVNSFTYYFYTASSQDGTNGFYWRTCGYLGE